MTRPIGQSLAVFPLLLLVAGLAAVSLAGEDDPKTKPPVPGLREGTANRETMWKAPTAEDWKKPVLIQFQRTWADAVAVSKETGKPILICINMDGEIASEHYAGIRYRQPDVAELYKPYVCVLASVYRHNPRDHDDEGNRILCPRFGSVTCGEHIQIEPGIFKTYCDGKRIAPRHIAVDLEKAEVYDVYYANDTASVFEKIRDGADDLPPPNPPIIRGDRPIFERVASRHIEDRDAVEAAYQKGDVELRKKLLDAALQHGESEPLDLLRLAIFGLDGDLAGEARDALQGVRTPLAIPLISDSLQVPMDAAERDRLIDTLESIGSESTLAQWLAGVHRGLAARSSKIRPSDWTGGATYPAPEDTTDATDGSVWQAEERAREAEARPTDAAAQLGLAEANLAIAIQAPQAQIQNPRLGQRLARAAYEDAWVSGKEAERLGASGWKLESLLTLAAYYTDHAAEAYVHAEKAMDELPANDPSWRSMAVVTVFAESRWKAIRAAVKAQEKWPAEWLADLHAAYAVLQRHPLGTDAQVVWHHDFLVWLGGDHRAMRVLEEGLGRFAASPALHQRLVRRLLKKRGVQALESTYATLLETSTSPAQMLPFVAEASIRAAEQYRRSQRYAEALAAYGRGIARYEEIGTGWNARISLALAGRARVAYQLLEVEQALADILASFAQSPETAGTRDRMGITPGETGQMLLARLKALERADLAGPLEAALADLDPELLRPDRGLLPQR